MVVTNECMVPHADAVRVTVRRDGRTESTEVEVLGPEGWGPCPAAAVRLDADVETGRAGAALTLAAGGRVEVGAPGAVLTREDLRAMLAQALEQVGGKPPARTADDERTDVVAQLDWLIRQADGLGNSRAADTLSQFRAIITSAGHVGFRDIIKGPCAKGTKPIDD